MSLIDHKCDQLSEPKIAISSEMNQNNWYAKLHPIGIDNQADEPKRLLNLSIFFRIWLAVALVLIICGVVVFTQLFGYVKPTAQQVIEDTLLDTSQILAVSLQVPLESGELLKPSFQSQLDRAFVGTPTIGRSVSDNSIRNIKQPIYQKKTRSSFHIYVTDAEGIVIYDSQLAPDNDEGADYSRWNDIYLTLQGQYGARTTVDTASKVDSSIMYVAQPIKNASNRLIGVVSVGKPVDSVLPYLENTRQRMLITALLISIVALLLAGLVAWWLKQSITLVTHYTGALAEDTKKPYFYLGHELNSLTDTIEDMKHRLENRAYVSDYVHTLTHELKSPLTAIRASSELLEDDGLDPEDRQMLSETIGEQSIKMQQLIDRLLLLAKVEQPTFKLNRQNIAIIALLNSLIKNSSAKLQQRRLPAIELFMNDKISVKDDITQNTLLEKTIIYADSFWLLQALQNVLDNAIYFAEHRISINIDTSAKQSVTLTVFNDGKHLPDYALSKAFDRYFSLSHQVINHVNKADETTDFSSSATINTLKKGTGLGLTLVKQVIEHHGGSVSLNNINADVDNAAGVIVNIILPLATTLMSE